MNLFNEESIFKAVEGCTYIVHTAAVVTLKKPKDEQILIKPAVEGNLAMMKAATLHGIKRVVITSSIAAVDKKG